MCSRNGDNRRVGLPLGGGSIGNRERMVWEPEGAAYDTANRKERNIQERKGAFKQLKRTFGIERINSGGDGSVLLEANYDESNGGDFRRSVRVAECTPKCTDHSKEGITRHLCGSSAERFNQTSPNMRKSTRNLGENDTTRLLFAWHVAALEHGIEHRWLELMCLLQETKNWDNRQFALLKVLDSELQKQDKYASDPFCYEYGDGWSADSVDSCFCRELPYNKLRKLLCDVGDEYSLGVLIESNNNIAGLVCLTLGSFQNSLKGMSRALGTKETIAILRKMGMLASARVIVYFDNHNYSVVTILVIEAGRCQKGGDCAFSHEGTQEQKPENTTTSTVHSIQELKGGTAARFRGYGRFKIPSAEDAGE